MGVHQFQRPSSRMVAGTRSVRTRAASTAMATAGARFGQIFIEPLAQLHAQGRLPVYELDPRLGEVLPSYPDLPAPVAAFFLKSWTRIYGVIMAAAFGHLNWAVAEASVLFEAEIMAMAESLVSKSR